MKFIFFLLSLLFITAINAQMIQNNNIIIGKTDSLYSKILGEERMIWVYLPPGYNDPLMADKRYPVMYLLDGDADFRGVTGMVDKLSEDGITTCPQMIVVAILNRNRSRDLTPTHSQYNDRDKVIDEFTTSSGGGESFAAFMQRELIPHIDSLYPSAPFKILVGGSLGGLTVMNILINHTGMFNAYVAIEPSMWWDNKKLLTQAHEAFKQKSFEGTSLYLAIANTMTDDLDTLQVRNDTSKATRHIRYLLELKDLLQSNPDNGLKWAFRYYDNDYHNTVALAAEYDALRFLFASYKMSNSDWAKMLVSDDADIIALLDAHYTNISKFMGYKVLPAEGETLGLAWYFLQMNRPKKAYQMFTLDIQNHPQSSVAYDGMGDYYSNQKDTVKAIEFYNKSLELKDNSDTRRKRDEIHAKE